METRDSLVFASKILDYLKVRTQEISDEIANSDVTTQRERDRFCENLGARKEIVNLLKWLYEH